MKFAHLADCHAGGWREPKMRELSIKAFETAVEKCIAEPVDFVIIAGDLFNTAVPSIETLKAVAQKLKQLKDAQIPVYTIAGSHDYSPSGKTILDVLETAGLVVNVARENNNELEFTKDLKTGALITGIVGRKGGLEKNLYPEIEVKKTEEDGFKIFVFHTALTELKTRELEKMDSISAMMLPEGFDYYAGGHVHIVESKSFDKRKNIVYPGPLFPNNFSELEKLGRGSFAIVENGIPKLVPVELKPVVQLRIDAEGKTPEEVERELKKSIENAQLNDAILTIRVEGTLKTGKPSDINFKKILTNEVVEKAYFVMKNTNNLESKEFEEIKVSESTVEEIELAVIASHAGQSKMFSADYEKELMQKLLTILSAEKQEGEKTSDFEKRISTDTARILMNE